jgi:hypothetical protein
MSPGEVYGSLTGAEELAIEAAFGAPLEALAGGAAQLRAATFRPTPTTRP